MEIAAIIGAIATLVSAIGGLIWQIRRSAARKRAAKSDLPTSDPPTSDPPGADA